MTPDTPGLPDLPAPQHPWDYGHELVGAHAAARLLDLHPRYADQVVRAGLAGPGYLTARGRLVGRDAVAALARRPVRTPDELPPALVLRPGPPRPSGDGWTGVHTAMPDDAVRACALRWWPVADPAALDGRLVVAAVAGFAVWAGRVRGHEEADGLVALDARSSVRDGEAEAYFASRLALPAGAATLRIRV